MWALDKDVMAGLSPHDEEGQDRLRAIGGGRRRVEGLWRDRETTANRAVSVGELVGIGIRPAMP